MFGRILLVCVGNICRSPTAEYVFRKRLPDAGIAVESAGLGAMVGRGMDRTALAVLAGRGIDGSAHVARQLSASMLRAADLVLAMEKPHLAAIGRIAPEASGKSFLLGKWQGGQAVPDPYRRPREVFEHVYELVDASVARWIERLG